MDLKFDANGLIPAIVQDHYTKEVLTLAYMNAESLAITIDEGRTCFFSRSRQQLWRKGETSGNVQHVVSITADCDKDALVVEVVKDGPACHTGAESCFFRPVYLSEELKAFSYEGLYRLIQGRKTDPKEGSYTTLSLIHIFFQSPQRRRLCEEDPVHLLHPGGAGRRRPPDRGLCRAGGPPRPRPVCPVPHGRERRVIP